MQRSTGNGDDLDLGRTARPGRGPDRPPAWAAPGTALAATVPVAPPSRLVTGGSFRFIRNPTYAAALAALFGQALWFGSRPVALAFHLFVVGYDEPVLRRTFGAEYEDYCRRVGRWFPRRPRCP